ncbi:PREDICTED: membrane cofactor protein-like [Miniopterus natalensis]|uniref:membrane cofactor protein-like n=1 Tax=Miniopterus natalensis TaxID=291302 RepID=UPI0007A6CBD5|nr:PREDICTED: membrane cofactor protein-like [Miniopterus natalensis]
MKPKGTPAPPYNIGVEIDYECLPGYVPKDPPLPTNVVCQKNSTWTHIMEACTTNECEDPPKFHSMLPKGNITPPYNIGVEIDYECLPGYIPKDPPLPTRIVCHKNATWTKIMEACTSKYPKLLFLLL